MIYRISDEARNFISLIIAVSYLLYAHAAFAAPFHSITHCRGEEIIHVHMKLATNGGAAHRFFKSQADGQHLEGPGAMNTVVSTDFSDALRGADGNRCCAANVGVLPTQIQFYPTTATQEALLSHYGGSTLKGHVLGGPFEPPRR